MRTIRYYAPSVFIDFFPFERLVRSVFGGEVLDVALVLPHEIRSRRPNRHDEQLFGRCRRICLTFDSHVHFEEVSVGLRHGNRKGNVDRRARLGYLTHA